MRTFEVFKPEGTIYSDFTFKNGKLYAIFERNDGRVNTSEVCKTDITNETWIIRDEEGVIKGFNGQIEETEKVYKITLND